MSGLRIIIQERGRTSITTEEICKMSLDESYSVVWLQYAATPPKQPHRCILTNYFNNYNFNKLKQYAP